MTTLIQRFLLENCESCADSGIFSQDLYDLFSRRHPGIAFNTFMSHCDRQARQLFQAKKDRKRRPGGTNPISYIIGIRIPKQCVIDYVIRSTGIHPEAC